MTTLFFIVCSSHDGPRANGELPRKHGQATDEWQLSFSQGVPLPPGENDVAVAPQSGRCRGVIYCAVAVSAAWVGARGRPRLAGSPGEAALREAALREAGAASWSCSRR